MTTPSIRPIKSVQRIFNDGDPVKLKGTAFVVDSRIGIGGFGDVYVLHFRDDPTRFLIAKFLRNLNEFVNDESAVSADEISKKLRSLFKREWTTLKKMSQQYPKLFPRFHSAGRYRGYQFYLMEKLLPMSVDNLAALKDDDARAQFICNVCDAVAALHENGLVHYDIKPENILKRGDTGEYVLGDFGSVHKEQKHFPEEQFRQSLLCSSISMISDGRRIAPRTVGYCDPIDSLHTIHADIYAIGQVIRDMFAAEVPPMWSRIILKCINRRFGLRYNSVGEVKSDVLSMGGDGARLLSQELSRLMDPKGLAWRTSRPRVFVDAHAGLGGNGTEKRPFDSIQMAVDRAEEDSVVVVRAGIYRESLVLSDKKISIVALDGPKRTVISGERDKSVVRIADGADGSVLKGFTITGGTGTLRRSSSCEFEYYGGGVNVDVSALIENCVIEGNGHGEPKKDSSTFGGGVYVSSASVTMKNCLIRNNYAWASGGGLMVDNHGGLVVNDCTIKNNRSEYLFGIQGGISLTNGATLYVNKSIVEGNAGDQIGACCGALSKGTRAQIENSYIEGGARACNISLFIPQRNNIKFSPDKRECGFKPV